MLFPCRFPCASIREHTHNHTYMYARRRHRCLYVLISCRFTCASIREHTHTHTHTQSHTHVCTQAAQVSAALKPLCWWVLSVAELVRTRKQAEIKRGKIAEAESRVAAAEKCVRGLCVCCSVHVYVCMCVCASTCVRGGSYVHVRTWVL